MESKELKKEEAFIEDYNKIMKDFNNGENSLFQTPQWMNPGDFIAKFSLYEETPNSITSTDTKVNLGN